MTHKSTNFKRIALAVVVALGVGLFSAGPSAQATPVGASLTIDSTTTKSSSITAGDTATATLKTTFTTEGSQDSVLVRTTCLTPAGTACDYGNFDIDFYWSATPESATGTVVKAGVKTTGGFSTTFTQNVGDSIVVTNAANDGAATSFTWSVKARTTAGSTPVGTYAITFYLQGSNAGAIAAAANANSQSVTWNVTVDNGSTTIAGLVTYVGSAATGTGSGSITAAATQALYYRQNAVWQSAKESAIVFATTAADAQSPVAAGVVYGFPTNSAGETKTAGGAGVNLCSGTCTLTAVMEGPGLLTKGDLNSGTPSKSVTVSYLSAQGVGSNETLTVYADGTPGTSYLKFYNGSVVVKSVTVTFTGAPASAVSLSLSETYVTRTAPSAVTLSAIVRDAALNTLNQGTVYVYASDTKVVTAKAMSTDATQYAQLAAGAKPAFTSHACNYVATAGRFSCTITVADSGTATLVLRDSWTVAASTWVSDAVTVNGTGAASSYKIAFDKTSYAPGALAIMSITGTDLAGKPATSGNSMSLTWSMALGNSNNSTAASSKGAQAMTSDTYSPNKVVGFSGAYEATETFVVYMPATVGTLTVTGKVTPFGLASTILPVEYTASVTIADPVQTAQNAAISDAQAAADAATDAALQAIDAANAATDAANLAAEAADAATVAAEEAKDAADAATAAVEGLATQVATLMAALQAQIRSLSNTVAKIAKKVKA